MKNLSVRDYLFTGVQLLLFLIYLGNFDLFEVSQTPPDFLMGLLVPIVFVLCLAAIEELNASLSPFPKPKTKSKLVTSMDN